MSTMDPHEQYYLQRIGETAAATEKRVADLTVRNRELEAENIGLTKRVDELERTTRDLALESFAKGEMVGLSTREQEPSD